MSGNMTRIKNNQITVQTIDYTRLVPGTLVGSVFNPQLTLNSNVTILGNLSVSGNTSTINSINTYIQDPIVVFNSGYTGSLTGYDMGILVNRNYSTLAPYGAVNTAWVWVENDQAWEAIATATSGNALTTLTSSGFANAKMGNTTVTSLTSTGAITSPSLVVTSASYTTSQATNFSSGNAVISGGYITGLANLQATNISGTTGVLTNLSSGNALLTGGTISGITTMQAANFSSANILVSGGNANGLTTLGATTGVVTNLSTSNLQATSGSVGTLVATTGFSTANAVVTSLGATTLVATNFSSGNVQLNGADNNGVQYTSGVLQITGGAGISGNLYVQGNVYAGNLISTTTQILSVTDPLLYLSASNPSTYNYEIGVYSHFGPTGGLGYQHTGFVRDHNDYVWKLFSNVPEPSGGTVNFTNAIYDTLKLGSLIIANSTASSSTTTGALQVAGGVGIGGQINATGISATTGSISTLVAATGFSTANAIITNSGTTTGVVTNFSSGNAQITGGTITGLTALGATTLVVTNFSSGNAVITGGYIGSTANITTTGFAIHGGNVVAAASTASTSTTTGALVVTGGVGIGGNINAGQSAVFNTSQGAGMDFIVKGKNDGTLIWARPNATYDTVIVGNSATSSTVVNGAKLMVNTTDSIMLPVGTNAQRPGSIGFTDTAGMLRYSSTANAIEWYNGTSWASASTSFTVIVSNQFNGDSATTGFTLTQASTTAAAVVSVNGVVQIPVTAYSISGTTLTFTEAPATGDVIDVRLLTTTSTVTGLSSATGKAQVNVDDVAGISFVSSSSAAQVFTMPLGGGLVSQDANVIVGSANTPTTIDSFATTLYRTAKYIVQVTNGTNFQSQEVLLVQNGTTATITTYGTVATGGNLGVMSANISGSNTNLTFTAANATNTVRLWRQYLQM